MMRLHPVALFKNNRLLLLSAITTVALTIMASQQVSAQIRPPLGNPSPTATPGAGSGGGGGRPQGGGLLGQPGGQPGGFSGGGSAGGGNDFISQTERELQQQASGQYPQIERSSTLPIGAIQNRWNKPSASQGQTAPGIMRFTWRPDFVMPVRTREFMTTTIELPAWENVERIILGDTMVFEATRVKKHIIVLRPSHAGADTNMTAIGTSGNIYNFYLRSEGWNSQAITDFTVYVSAAPMGSGIMSPDSQGSSDVSMGGRSSIMDYSRTATNSGAGNVRPPDYVREIAYDPANLEFDLRIFAPSPRDIEIAPLRAFTDGVWTYFDYGELADTVRRPVVYQVIDGVDSMINTRTAGPNGSIVIAEAVGDFTLKNGERVVCVYRTNVPRSYTARQHFQPHTQPDPYSVNINRSEDSMALSAPGLTNQLEAQPYRGAIENQRTTPRDWYNGGR